MSIKLTETDRDRILANDGLFQGVDVIIQRPNRSPISLGDRSLLMSVGRISLSIEDMFGEFTAGAVEIGVSNFYNDLDTGNPDGYFYQLDENEVVTVEVFITLDNRYKVFRGVLSFKESTFNIDQDEGSLYVESEIKKYTNVSAEQMWGSTDPHKFKHVADVVKKCLDQMETDQSDSINRIIEEPSFEGDDRTFSYYDRIDKDESVNSIAVDGNGMVYQCTKDKIYSLDPQTREKEILIQGDLLSHLLYYDTYLYWLDGNNIKRCKTDGALVEKILTFASDTLGYPAEPIEIQSKQMQETTGNGVDYPVTYYLYQLVGFFWAGGRYQPQVASSPIDLSAHAYVDFAYADQVDSDPILMPGGSISFTLPVTKHKVRAFRIIHETRKFLDQDRANIFMQYMGTLPLHLPPGKYCFVSYTSSDDLLDEPEFDFPFKDNHRCRNHNPSEVPKKFKVLIRRRSDFSMCIVNDVLFFTNMEDDFKVRAGKIDLTDFSNQSWQAFSGNTPYSLNRPLVLKPGPLNSLLVGYTNEDGIFGAQYSVIDYSTVSLFQNRKLEDERKYFLTDIEMLSKKFVYTCESEDFPNLLDTGYNIGGRLTRDVYEAMGLGLVNPANLPFHMYDPVDTWTVARGFIFISGIDDPDISEIPTPILFPFYRNQLEIFLPGDLRQENQEVEEIKYFSEDDPISIKPIAESGYDPSSAPVTAIEYQTEYGTYIVSWSKIQTLVPIHYAWHGGNKIYKAMGNLPPLNFVKAEYDMSIRKNYQLVEKEEYSIAEFPVKEKAESVKITNPFVVMDSNFKIQYENEQEVPDSVYEIYHYQGTHRNQTWIYFLASESGKKVLITYNYIDPDVTYQSLIRAGDKVYCVETKTNKLISIAPSGTGADLGDFQDEGLTYLKEKERGVYEEVTEMIKPDEESLNADIVYDSVNDRIYGITAPNDFALFQFAKNISPYIEDVFFKDQNCLQVLVECARICGFIIWMDNDKNFYFVSRDYFSRLYPVVMDDSNISDLTCRQSAYEFGEHYDRIEVTFQHGEETYGDGRLKLMLSSSMISSRGWGRYLAKFLYNLLSKMSQVFVFKCKELLDLQLLNDLPIRLPEKSISALGRVKSMDLNPEDIVMEVIAKEVKTNE